MTSFGTQGQLKCTDSVDTIEFDMQSPHAMRVKFGGGPPEYSSKCCSASNPRRVCNAPDKQTDIDELCRNLGYERAYVKYIFIVFLYWRTYINYIYDIIYK